MSATDDIVARLRRAGLDTRAEARVSANGLVPKRERMASQPATTPGTVTE